MGEPSELEVLLAHLEELLAEEAVEAEDALEIAVTAGLASRMGADKVALTAADAWRTGPGADALDQAFRELNLEQLVEAMDVVSAGPSSVEEVEEALYEFDEVVAAAVWCGKARSVTCTC